MKPPKVARSQLEEVEVEEEAQCRILEQPKKGSSGMAELNIAGAAAECFAWWAPLCHRHQFRGSSFRVPSPWSQQRCLLLGSSEGMLLAVRLPIHLEVVIPEDPVAVLTREAVRMKLLLQFRLEVLPLDPLVAGLA